MSNRRRAGAAIAVAVSMLMVMAGARMLGQGASGQGESAAVRAAIEAGNRKVIDGAAKRDAALIASVYSEDGEAFPPNGEAVKGRPALQKMWQGVLDSGIAASI
jgi:hypothetical protein